MFRRAYEIKMTLYFRFVKTIVWHTKHLTVCLNPFLDSNIYKPVFKCSAELEPKSCQISDLSLCKQEM